MNCAENLVKTLLAGNVDIRFAKPGYISALNSLADTG
jgi:hypothetical protein